MAENRLITWFVVPDNSTLRIKVSGSDGNFNVTGIQVTQPGGVATLTHQQLVAGADLTLLSPNGYSTTLAIAFLGQNATTVTVEASVTKANGKPFGEPRQPHVVTGSANQTDSMMVLAITKQN